MLTIYGYKSFNPFKVVATAEELGLDYDYRFVDLGKRENATPEYQAKHPFAKVPVLEHDGHCISESAAICRYLARINDDRLYSGEPLKAADIDSVLDMMNLHIGRWMSIYFWEELIKPRFYQQDPDKEKLAEAEGFLAKQLPPVDRRLERNGFLCGEGISIADTFALAYFMLEAETSIDFSSYGNIQRWYETMLGRPAIVKARQIVFSE